MKVLVIIPARGGSKGVPKKNIKVLGAKPLIHYSIDVAKQVVASLEDICVSTDSEEIKKVAEAAGIRVPFLRPEALATDQASSRDVILHALDHYASQGKVYDAILLLQPTSPFRRVRDVKEMIVLYSPELDMIVSVNEPHHNPYFSLFEENENQYLELSKKGNFTRRQDAPKVYAYNGSVYVINPQSIRYLEFSQFKKVKKYVMDDVHSIDIDTPLDWRIAEAILESNLVAPGESF